MLFENLRKSLESMGVSKRMVLSQGHDYYSCSNPQRNWHLDTNLLTNVTLESDMIKFMSALPIEDPTIDIQCHESVNKAAKRDRLLSALTGIIGGDDLRGPVKLVSADDEIEHVCLEVVVNDRYPTHIYMRYSEDEDELAYITLQSNSWESRIPNTDVETLGEFVSAQMTFIVKVLLLSTM